MAESILNRYNNKEETSALANNDIENDIGIETWTEEDWDLAEEAINDAIANGDVELIATYQEVIVTPYLSGKSKPSLTLSNKIEPKIKDNLLFFENAKQQAALNYEDQTGEVYISSNYTQQNLTPEQIEILKNSNWDDLKDTLVSAREANFKRDPNTLFTPNNDGTYNFGSTIVTENEKQAFIEEWEAKTNIKTVKDVDGNPVVDSEGKALTIDYNIKPVINGTSVSVTLANGETYTQEYETEAQAKAAFDMHVTQGGVSELGNAVAEEQAAIVSPEDTSNTNFIGKTWIQVEEELDTLGDSIIQYRLRNGLNTSEEQLAQDLDDIFTGNKSTNDIQKEMQETLAGMYPAFADKIKAGTEISSIARNYVDTMAQTLELSPDNIDILDPNIQKALTAVGENGQPKFVPLWEFQKDLKKDPRWQTTNAAYNAYGDLASELAQIFGMV